MNKILRLTIALAALLWCGIATAQTRLITGMVKDDKGNALPAVAVQVKGTTIGTYTDNEGKFTLAVPEQSKTLTFHFTGMKNQEVAVSDAMAVTMMPDVLGINEVVVTALGVSHEKKALGYSTQTVGSEQLNTSGTGNPLSELSGKVSGLTVINSSGDPGAGTYINLRGVTSLTGNNQPLMIVDGIPIDNSINNYDPTFSGFQASNANGNLTGGVQPTNRGIDINPNDIESMTVLKGPTATALYGIQAASGAIIITTKKGTGGKGGMHISFNSSTSASSPNRLPGRQDKWGQGSGGLYYGPDANTSKKKFSWGPSIDTLYRDGVPTPYDKNGSIVGKSNASKKTPVTVYNPYDFFVTGVTYDNNLALSGGNDRSGYRMSIGNVNQTGIVPNSAYNKSSFSLNGQSSIGKRLTISGGSTYTLTSRDATQQGSNISGVMLGLLRTPPTFDNANGNPRKSAASDSTSYVLPNGKQRDYRGGAGYDNPYWTVNRNPFHEELNRVFSYGQASYHLFDWMDITYRLGGDVYSQDDKNAYDIHSNQFSSGAIYLTDYFNRQFNSDLIVNMQKKFSDKFSGGLLLGQNYFASSSSTRLSTGSGFVLPDFLDMSNATSFLNQELESKKRTSAWYGSAELQYANMLFVTLTGRDETTSTLATNHDNFFYPSGTVSWIFTEPLHLSTNKILPFGKLRASFAQVGKDAPAQALQTYYFSAANTNNIKDGFTNGVSFPINGNAGYAISDAISVIGNPLLVPEKTNSQEVGVDLVFLQNRISLSATYYHSLTTNEIFTVPIAYSTGFASALLNAGSVSNKGGEISLNTTPIKTASGFRWDLNFNWSRNVNEVVSLAPGVTQLFIAGFTNGGIYALPGKPFGEIFGTDIIHTDATDRNSPTVLSDVKGAGYAQPIVGSQSVPLGNIQPDWIGSMINNFTFKGLTLGVQLDVRHGGAIWNGTRGAMTYFGTSDQTNNRGSAVTFKGVLGHLDANGNIVHYAADGKTEVAGAGSNNTIASVYDQYYYQNIGSSFVGPTSVDVVNGGFVRIRQISLSYAVSKKICHKIHFTDIMVTVFANNPFLWTEYPGVDPETSLAGPSNGQGLDYFNNPGTKSYGVRLNLGL